MATRYVRTNGNDGGSGHDGTTPALAWLTLGYAMTHVSAGDTIYVGGGTYRISSTIAPSSMASMTYLYGDPFGTQTGDVGEVIVTNYATNDTTAPSACVLFTFASKNYWTIGNLTLIAGNVTKNEEVFSFSGTSHDVVLQDITSWSQWGRWLFFTMTFGTVWNITIDRCRIFNSGHSGMVIFTPTSASSSGDINLNMLIRNCLIESGNLAIDSFTDNTGTARKSGGISITNCTTRMIYLEGTAANYSTTYPWNVTNCLLLGVYGINSPGAGIVTEDYNVFFNDTPRTNVSAGTHSKADNSLMGRLSLGTEQAWGGATRPYGEPVAGSGLLSWGGSSPPSVDMWGNTRPGSGVGTISAAVGALERGNSATKEVTTVRTGSNAIKLSGPGFQDFALPVAAASTTVTVYGRFDASYGAGTKPTMSVRNGGECGVADATATMTVASGNWEQLSLTFTPTATGIVTIRLASLGSAAAGGTFWDDFAVA
jgi:hypothetical protein